MKLYGEEHSETLREAGNYAIFLIDLKRFEEAKGVLRKAIPVAHRIHGTDHTRTLSLREDFARATLYGGSSPEEKREALRMLEDTLGVIRRVLGAQHPETRRVQHELDRHQEAA